MTAAERAARTEQADALCLHAYDAAGGPSSGAALVAVGGFGRGDLAPHSDLDVVLVLDDDAGPPDPAALADRIWYPLWDAEIRLDHAVRTTSGMLQSARDEVRVALGLLDLRHLAGDPNLSLRLRSAVLAQWRRDARVALPALRALVTRRHEVAGELAHQSVPDMKEAQGGLRDATVLAGLATSWLVDVSAADLVRCRTQLLDVRDLLHTAAGRGSDRIGPEHWSAIAAGLDLPDDAGAQRHVRLLGRRMTHLSRLAWRRADDALRRPRAAGPRRPELIPIAPGVALSRDEVVLDRGARPATDPVLLLRAAAEAARRDAVLAPPTAARLVRECPPLPNPWPEEARQQFVRLLAAGPGLRGVWETLEETGALDRILPEWERIRLLPHASVVHRFTVDRHVVEAWIEAAALIRDVARPDVLVVAALLHDIGKGGLVEHSVAGEPIAREIAARMGFDDESATLIGCLVRRHLLLADLATTRDPEDPATVAALLDHVDTPDALELLTALTEADARAASAKAWSSWRAGLVRGLSRRARAALAHTAPSLPDRVDEVAIPAIARGGGIAITVEGTDDGTRVTVVAPDRVGLLAEVAAMFALCKVPVRAARIWSQEQYGVSVWDVADHVVDTDALRDRYAAVVHRRVDPGRRLAPRGTGVDEPAPSVAVRPEASNRSTVLEVRTADRLGTVHLVSAALARLGISVRSAHVSTLGPQAVDAFYLREEGAGALSETRAAQAAHAVREAITAAD